MKKILKNSKRAAIIQYISIMIFVIGTLGIAIVCNQLGNTVLSEGSFSMEELKSLAILTLGGSVIIQAILGPLALVLALIFGIIGSSILILSTIALILNLYKSTMKRWKVARILNLICIAIIVFGLIMCYNLPVINIILLAIVILNIYIMFFYKPDNLMVIEESESL